MNIPVGIILPIAANDAAPNGWLLCDGTIINNQYINLIKAQNSKTLLCCQSCTQHSAITW
ncbi:MAG: tail fiber protein [Alteromonadaceae bacterium]|nr:tail fiber protein [Alteromonadaceae bacterium]